MVTRLNSHQHFQVFWKRNQVFDPLGLIKCALLNTMLEVRESIQTFLPCFWVWWLWPPVWIQALGAWKFPCLHNMEWVVSLWAGMQKALPLLHTNMAIWCFLFFLLSIYIRKRIMKLFSGFCIYQCKLERCRRDTGEIGAFLLIEMKEGSSAPRWVDCSFCPERIRSI